MRKLLIEKAALLQAVDEYSAYMKSKVNTAAIAKGDSFFDVPETEIQKAGKKVSGKNLEALKAAQRALSAVISEAEPEPEQTAEEKQAGEYRCNIARMIYDIESLDTIASIYSFIIGLLVCQERRCC